LNQPMKPLPPEVMRERLAELDRRARERRGIHAAQLVDVTLDERPVTLERDRASGPR
jgi:hypothetical protein